MNKPTVAFQGEPGAYSEAAVIEFFNREAVPVPCPSFENVFTAVTDQKCDYGLLPIENSLAGSIHRNYDLMLRHNLHIVGEYHLRISHCLLTLPGVRIEDIRTVHSHPQALAQCENSLAEHNFLPVVEADTAGSARLLAERQDRTSAALASRRAAEVYGLEILNDHMEDNAVNFTRFLVLSPESCKEDGQGKNSFKTSIVFSLNNHPGVLFKALSVFALREIDLTKIESRPIPGSLWEYVFYIDFIGNISNQSSHNAIDHLSELSTFQRVLGSYPRHIPEVSV